MNQRSLRYLKSFIDFLQKLYEQSSTTKQEDPLPYEPLSPTGNAEEVEEYSKALTWALKNRKKHDIKNIALTGPYGSGKSSILKTFKETNTDDSLHFLFISLATFKEETEEPTKDNPTSFEQGNTLKTDLLRLIELSILQQIFYREDDNNIPDSRFRKIRSYTKLELKLTTFWISIFLISITHLIYPILIPKQFGIIPNEFWSIIFHWMALVTSVFIGIKVIYKSIRMLSALKISKLNIQNAEINISNNISKSILNHHLDEILYFFQVTPYNVVIIEDLDRFRQTDIFTKLREINLLINQSDKIKKDVVFIYAVRDDMFKLENERTKFFDFIIPVIPVINPSNSSNKLLHKITTNGYTISEDLIDSIARFIDDMRLLHNITNEYYLYRQKLNKGLIQGKLLSIIVYKNLFPDDFTDLTYNKGKLFDALNGKQIYIAQQTEKLRALISEWKVQIEDIEAAKVQDIQEIRKSYLLHAIENISPFVSFYANGGQKTFQEMTDDENFHFLMTNGVQYYDRNPTYNSPQKLNIDFKTLEKRVNPKTTYTERKKQIEDYNNNLHEQLKKQIQENEKEISMLRQLKIKDLFEKANIRIEIEHEKQNQLVNVLLRNGYIDEDYLDYISIFYPGSISREDNQFLMNVKTNVETDYDHKLHKIENLVKKLNIAQFNQHFIFNYQLMDFLLSNNTYKTERDGLFSKLADQSEESLKFIDGFILNGKRIRPFTQILVKKWLQIWDYITEKSKYPEDKKSEYFKLLLQFSDLADLDKMFQSKNFRRYLLQQRDFLSAITDTNRIKEIIKKLNIKFIDLDEKYSPTELLDFIYDGSYYDINPQMLRLILTYKQAPTIPEFESKNYYCIVQSKCDALIKYVNDNLIEYLTNVYIELDNNTQEPETELLLLLNNQNLELGDKEMVIQQVETRLSDLSKVEDVNTKQILLAENRVTPVWENLIDYYHADGSTGVEDLLPFIEEKDNLAALASKKIPKGKETTENVHENDAFILSLVKEERLSDIAYSHIAASFPYWYRNLDFTQLSPEKVRSLINHQTLRLNIETFKRLKEFETSIVILLLEKQKATLMQELDNYKLDTTDITAVLKSNAFSGTEKNVIVEKAEESLLISSGELLELIGVQILKDKNFRVTNTLLKSILLNLNLSKEQRIRIFVGKQSQVSDQEITQFLDSLDAPYTDIIVNGKRPMLPKTEYNMLLAQQLLNRKYVSSIDNKESGIRINTFSKE